MWSRQNASGILGWEKLDDASYVAIGVYLMILAPIAIFGNCLVLFVFWRKSLYKRPVNWFIVNLAVSDLIVAVFAHPLSAISSFSQRWSLATTGCYLYGFIAYTGGCNNIMTYAAISYFRCQIVCDNRYVARVKGGRIISMLVSIWMFSLFWTVSPLLGWNTYELEPYELTCSLRWFGNSAADKSYIWLCLIFVYLSPLSIMIYSYIRIAKHARRLSASSLPGNNETKSKFLYNLEKGATRISLIMTFTFMFTWTPYAILSLMTSVGLITRSPAILLPTLFAKSSCAYNPFVFFLSHNTFKSFNWGFASCAQNKEEQESTKVYISRVRFQNRIKPSDTASSSTAKVDSTRRDIDHQKSSRHVTLTVSDLMETSTG
ncbi:rhodopsin, G0-coupled-like [Ostrea edulis]|uniref:rhodopsin, G0-coupled-like n=1 Tax=Ostrea edulis TaxID=37623 RepID=UPI0024AEDFC8|nr:rhodopsin, G0-coupled-like [Ostrea edulis]